MLSNSTALARLCALTLCAIAACRAPEGSHAATQASLDLPDATAHPARPLAIDVEHYAIEIELDPNARILRGVCTIRLAANEEALRQVVLDFEGLSVSSVHDERDRILSFQHARGALKIELAQALARGDFVELTVAYAGVPKKGVWFTGDAGRPATAVFTQGECEDARWWFPCQDLPADRATSELCVTMPRTWIAVAAGVRVERSEHDGLATERWRMSEPHPAYLTTLVAGELQQENGVWDGVPLSFLSSGELAQYLQPTFEETDEVLGFFSELTGRRYPYAKYAQACVDNFPFGGMENISATTLTDTTLNDERGRRDARSTGLVAHEAAHQWFGDLLTCREWSHIWLNEGFATYLAALYTEHAEGPDAFRIQMRDTQQGYLDGDVGKTRRAMISDVYRDPLDLFFDGHTYQGGAARLHLLRSVLGDEIFERGLKLYVGRNAGRGVVTDDLRLAMEEASQTELGWFFEQWFEKPGFPEFSFAWKYDARRSRVLLDVQQHQALGDGTPEAFRTPVEIEIADERGARIERLNIDKRRHLFELRADLEPKWVLFDAHGVIPKKCDEEKKTIEWLAIAAGCEDAAWRRSALEVLGRGLEKATGDERRILSAALVRSLADDKSKAVRAAAALALRADRSADARAALLARAFEDSEANVRAAALEALKAWGPNDELARFAQDAYAEGYSWNTMAQAAGLYATASPKDAFDRLQAVLALESPHDQWRAKLIHELAAVRDARVLPLLRGIANDARASEAARGAAVKELGTLGRGQLEVRRELVALLDTDRWRLRREVIAALGALKDPGVFPELRAYHERSVFAAERRAIEAILVAGAKDV